MLGEPDSNDEGVMALAEAEEVDEWESDTELDMEAEGVQDTHDESLGEEE